MSSITLQQIRELREHHAHGVGHEELARMYGLTENAVDLLCHGPKKMQRRRRHVLPSENLTREGEGDAKEHPR